jgi:hypothetical protein
MEIGVLVTCDDEVAEAAIVGVWRTPIRWGDYVNVVVRGSRHVDGLGCGLVRRIGR